MKVLWFFAKRFAWMLLTVWVIYTFSFFLMRIVPGGPFDSEKNVPAEVKRNIEKKFKLDQPLHRQYLAILSTEPLYCYRLRDYTVAEVVAEGFPISASLGVFALVFALSLGLTAGVVSALRRQSWLDVSLMSAATLGIAVPNFVLASLAVILFVFMLHWFPAAGWGTLGQIIMPALCLGAPFAAYIARLTRTGMLDVLGQDYIRTAYAKGIRPRSVVLRHALQGALLPVVSYLGPAIAGILTGSLVLEQIFALPGMGTHFIQGAIVKDYTLVMGMVLIYTVLLFVMNTLVDVAYGIIDPRVKLE